MTKLTATPKHIPDKGWDVEIALGDQRKLLCEGRGPYTMHQAQLAADSARRDYTRHGITAIYP